MNIKSLILILGISAMAWSSCETHVETFTDAGYYYYEFGAGRYVTYEVDSIVHDIPSSVQDTFHFYVKERIDSVYFDSEDVPTARIERSYKEELADDWEIRDIWTSSRTEARAVKVEENVRFVKLAFPVDEETEWDGNAQNTFDAWDYHYEDIEVSKQIGDTTYENTATVIQRDVNNLIERENAQEIYAYGVGMVYKQLDTLKYTISGGTSQLQTGIEYKMTAIETGVEE